MLGTVRDETGGKWSVLVLDAMTTKVMSCVAGISDILDYGVSREQGFRGGVLGPRGWPGSGCCGEGEWTQPPSRRLAAATPPRRGPT